MYNCHPNMRVLSELTKNPFGEAWEDSGSVHLQKRNLPKAAEPRMHTTTLAAPHSKHRQHQLPSFLCQLAITSLAAQTEFYDLQNVLIGSSYTILWRWFQPLFQNNSAIIPQQQPFVHLTYSVPYICGRISPHYQPPAIFFS